MLQCLASLFLLILIAISGVQPAFAASNIITVLQYGAIQNDGVDDTAAMQRAADDLCAKPGTTLRYPAGTYNVDRLVDFDTEFSGLIADKAITYSHCSNVRISGVGAKIEVKGDFKKGVARLLPDVTPPPLCHSPAAPFTLGVCLAVGEADIFQRVPFAFVDPATSCSPV